MKVKIFMMCLFVTSNSLAAGNGRYQITEAGSAIDKVMIDTQTGRLWKLRCAANGPGKECAYYAWTEEVVEGISMTKQEFANLVNRIEKNARESAE